MNDNLPPLPPYAPEFKPRWDTDPGGYNEEQMQAYAREAIEKDRAERQGVPADERTAFEAWITNTYPGVNVMRRVDGEYRSNTPDNFWSGWRARAALAAAPQPQPVQPEGPMAETVEQAARDVAKCLNERDGQGLDLRHVAMLAHYAVQQEPVAWALQFGDDVRICLSTVFDTRDEAQDYASSCIDKTELTPLYTSPQAAQPQPVQEQCPECDGTGTVAGSQAHFHCPLCTSPQAQPLSDEQIDALAGPGPDYFDRKVFARAIEKAHGIKGTT